MNVLIVIVMAMFLLGFLLASISAWFSIGFYLFQGGKIPSLRPKCQARWGLIDILLTGALVVFFQYLFVWGGSFLGLLEIPKNFETLDETLKSKIQFQAMTLASVSQIASMLASVAIVAFRTTSTWPQLGWTQKHLPRDLTYGVAAAVLFIPVVYVLMALTVKLSGVQYDHPIVKMISEGNGAEYFIMAAISAVLVAPITEEYLFRVLIQGYFQSLAERGVTLSRLIWGRAGVLGNEGADSFGDFESEIASGDTYLDQSNLKEVAISSAGNPVATTDRNPYAVAVRNLIVEPDDNLSDVASPNRPWWPVIASSLLFAGAHWSYGLSYIPLFFLACVLGVLYRWTNSIWPCWIVHVTLNGISIATMGVQVFGK